ncbi:MAG: hypothetical protein P4N41_08550 [Negativicutes bacterium]|nr:hypothetical protein [Negativicutes bacterium]
MAYILAGLMAALSFLLNRVALRYVGLKAVITCGPVLEEAVKSWPAFYLGADILLTHAGFGAIEAVYDWYTSQKHGSAAAALSIFGHGLFGLVTVGTLSLTNQFPLALGAAIVTHLAWNVVMIRMNS